MWIIQKFSLISCYGVQTQFHVIVDELVNSPNIKPLF